jgi:RNA-binding protein YlmH
VAALCNLSREGAKEKILSGEVEQNYETATEISASVNAADHISVRGVGKFLVVSVCDPTKKGRIRLIAKKFM